MLPGECHHQQEQAAEREGELLHLAAAGWIFDLHQARIVDRLGKVNFWSSRPARLPRTTAAAPCPPSLYSTPAKLETARRRFCLGAAYPEANPASPSPPAPPRSPR